MELLSLTSRELPCAQRDELQQLTVLARDAAEILFEMAAMQDKSPEAHDMLGKSQQIEVSSPQGLPLEHSAHHLLLCTATVATKGAQYLQIPKLSAWMANYDWCFTQAPPGKVHGSADDWYR